LKLLITGADGFIGKNLIAHLRQRKDIEILKYTKNDDFKTLREKLKECDFIFHLAGVNRPLNEEEFDTGNVDLTRIISQELETSDKSIPIVFTSSIQAELDNPYGRSKLKAENLLNSLNGPVYIYRLPNVFGKWSKPNYNSAVATFCHNIINDLPVTIHDPNSIINLVYVDDVIVNFIKLMDKKESQAVEPIYKVTVGELYESIKAFKSSRISLVSEEVGTGFLRALYSTYVSFLKPELFSYPLTKHEDPRGMFVEFLKTKNSGQFSFFTAKKGVTRGGHYHHSKTEKFLVVKGSALYKFLNIETKEEYEISSTGDKPLVVETVPGWSHNITNIGEEEMIVMLWANEVFDQEKPDTFSHKV